MAHVYVAVLLALLAIGAFVLADQDTFDLPEPPACTQRRGQTIVSLEEGRRICPNEPAVVHMVALDQDDVATFTLRFVIVEGRRDANSGMQIVDADGNTVASKADVLVAEPESLSQLVVRGDSAAASSSSLVCGHANRILISCGTACVTYSLEMTRQSRVGFNQASKTLAAAPEIRRADRRVNEFCGSLNVVKFCDNVHWWKVWLRPGDVLLMRITLEAQNSLIQMQLLDEDRVTLTSFFNVAVTGRRDESEIYTHSAMSGLHFVRLRATNDIFQYQVAFQVQPSSFALETCPNKAAGEDDAKTLVTVPLGVKCKKFRKLDAENISRACQDFSSGAAQACPTTCFSCRRL